MALFFDQAWFDQQLYDTQQTLDDVAGLLELTLEQVKEIWKDQRELLPHEVTALSNMFKVTPAEIADHAGVSTPVPVETEARDPDAVLTQLQEMNGRLVRMERAMIDLKILILEQRTTSEE